MILLFSHLFLSRVCCADLYCYFWQKFAINPFTHRSLQRIAIKKQFLAYALVVMALSHINHYRGH